jgi:hypothetical protein
MSEIMRWHHEALAKRTVEALKKNDFDAVYIPEKEKAVEFILGFVKSGAKVGFGGSMTTTALGLAAKVKQKGAIALDHSEPGLSVEQKIEIRREQLVCDLFISSSNAVTLDGFIFNVDGTGNRTNALTFGPRKVVIVVGMNKIRKDLDEALERVRHYAAPMNNKRLSTGNPCTVSGTCSECTSKSRICRIYSTLRRKPNLTDITVVVVGEALGY